MGALGFVVRRTPQLPILDSDMNVYLYALRTQSNLSQAINHLDNIIPLTEQLITCDIHLIYFKLSQNLALVLAKHYITILQLPALTLRPVCACTIEPLPEVESVSAGG